MRPPARPPGRLDRGGRVGGPGIDANGDKAAGVERLARDLGPAAGPELQMEYARLLAVADRRTRRCRSLGQLAERYPNSPDVAGLRGLISLDAGDLKTSWEQFGSLLAAGRLVPESLFISVRSPRTESRTTMRCDSMGGSARVRS